MEKKIVYIGKKADGALVWHTDLKAMEELDGVTKVLKEVPLKEFEAAGSIAREIKGKIVIGRTDEEKQAQANVERVRILKLHLAETDYVAAKIAEGSATKEEYEQEIAKREAWRGEIRQLELKSA